LSNNNFFWFRRDLRLQDNAGLYHALRSDQSIIPVFIFDRNILEKLDEKKDARVQFLHTTVTELAKSLQELGSNILVKYGRPESVWKKIFTEYGAGNIYTNFDFEPYAIKRDKTIADLLSKKDKSLFKFKDHIIFDQQEVLKADGTPYTVFTPYSKKWRAKIDSRGIGKTSYFLKAYPTKKYFKNFANFEAKDIPKLSKMGFKPSELTIPKKTVSQGLIKKYEAQRNFPSVLGTSKLGVHFRFGTISVREKARKAYDLSHTYVNELIWRDFYAQILGHFPHVVENAFRAKYDFIEWRTNEKDFQAWCKGQTGYPIVDAGMRELNATGFMHNRVRMITASFLTKHLLIDWRWGEAYFAQKLLDFDLASNNGGWQWAAGSGTDAAPYFRIFNPYTQADKFDKERKYIKKWVPEVDTDEYVGAIVDHKEARARCLATYKKGLERAMQEQ